MNDEIKTPEHKLDPTRIAFEAKASLTGELGESIAAAAKQTEHMAHELQGGERGLRQGSKAILKQLVALLEKECDEGAFKDKNGPNDIRVAIKRYIARASSLCDHLADIARNKSLSSFGAQSAHETMLTIVQKYHNAAVARVEQIDSPPAPVDPDNPDNLDAKGNPRRRPGEAPRARGRKDEATEDPKPAEGHKLEEESKEGTPKPPPTQGGRETEATEATEATEDPKPAESATGSSSEHTHETQSAWVTDGDLHTHEVEVEVEVEGERRKKGKRVETTKPHPTQGGKVRKPPKGKTK